MKYILGKVAIWPDYVSDGRINWQLKTTSLVLVYCLDDDFYPEAKCFKWNWIYNIIIIKYFEWKWQKNHNYSQRFCVFSHECFLATPHRFGCHSKWERERRRASERASEKKKPHQLSTGPVPSLMAIILSDMHFKPVQTTFERRKIRNPEWKLSWLQIWLSRLNTVLKRLQCFFFISSFLKCVCVCERVCVRIQAIGFQTILL